MANYFKFQFMGSEYEARCESRDTRNGFAHDCTVHDSNYYDCAEATCHYLNRTWECYRYESVLHKAIRNMAEEETNRAIEDYKEENGLSRLPKGKKAEIEAIYDAEYEKAVKSIVRL